MFEWNANYFNTCCHRPIGFYQFVKFIACHCRRIPIVCTAKQYIISGHQKCLCFYGKTK